MVCAVGRYSDGMLIHGVYHLKGGGSRGYLGVPVAVIDDNSISCRECDALSSRPCRQQEDETVCMSCTDSHKL